jgi:RimJ/RimL family protein N-acetyltransferase
MDEKNTPDVKISPTRTNDLLDLIRLWNDGRVMRWVGFPNGLEYDNKRVADWFSAVESNPDRHHFVIRDGEQGFCGELYYKVDSSHQIASLDIKLVPEAQGKGIARQAFGRLIDIVFQSEPDVELVWVEPWPDNKAAQKLYRRCGMSQRTRPPHLGKGPSYWELLRSEWSTGYQLTASDQDVI